MISYFTVPAQTALRANGIRRKSLILRDIFERGRKYGTDRTHLDAVMKWLCLAQDVNETGGVSAGYHLLNDYWFSYNGFKDSEYPSLHTIAYTIRGLMEVGIPSPSLTTAEIPPTRVVNTIHPQVIASISTHPKVSVLLGKTSPLLSLISLATKCFG